MRLTSTSFIHSRAARGGSFAHSHPSPVSRSVSSSPRELALIHGPARPLRGVPIARCEFSSKATGAELVASRPSLLRRVQFHPGGLERRLLL